MNATADTITAPAQLCFLTMDPRGKARGFHLASQDETGRAWFLSIETTDNWTTDKNRAAVFTDQAQADDWRNMLALCRRNKAQRLTEKRKATTEDLAHAQRLRGDADAIDYTRTQPINQEGA